MKTLNKKVASNMRDLEAYIFCCYCHCLCDCTGMGETVKHNRSDSIINSETNGNEQDYLLWW